MQVKTLMRKANKIGGLVKVDKDFFWTLPPKYKDRKQLSYSEFKEVVDRHFTLEEEQPDLVIVYKDKVVMFDGVEDIMD